MIDDDIKFKRRSLSDQIEALRSSTMKYGKISGAGVFEVANEEALDHLNGEITAVEGKAARLEEIAGICSAAYSESGVQDFKGLIEIHGNYQNTIEYGPERAWRALVLFRGEGSSGARNRTNLLPADLVQVPEYAAQEAAYKKSIDDATAADADLKVTYNALMTLTKEVAAL